MSFIKIINTKRVNQDDSAFPTIVKLNNSDLICGFSVGGGPEVTGGSDWARSTDNGMTWKHEGCILPRTENPVTVNTMRLSRTADGRVIAYGQRNYLENQSTKFGTLKNDTVFCLSDFDCRSWSKPQIVPHKHTCPFEVSNPIVVLPDGRWLAPAALLTDANHLGEKVIVSESRDEGKTWDNEYTVLADPNGEKCFFEQKIIQTAPDRLLAFAWTVQRGSYDNLCNHFAWSKDGGRSWSQPIPTTIRGQTLSPFYLGGNKFLLLYNDRHNPQGIKLAVASIHDSECKIMDEMFLWKPKSKTNTTKEGIDSFDDFAFGLPSITALENHQFLAVFWNKESHIFGISTIQFSLSREKVTNIK
ncbi:MAG: sialidase family protein [Lentisphaeria bacterium]